MRVIWIELVCALVSVQSVGNLVVARFIERAEIKPDLADVWIELDCATVCVESVAILADLIVQDTDGAPKGGISAIAVDGLLIRLVSLVVFLLGHVASTEEVPGLSVVAV